MNRGHGFPTGPSGAGPAVVVGGAAVVVVVVVVGAAVVEGEPAGADADCVASLVLRHPPAVSTATVSRSAAPRSGRRRHLRSPLTSR